jgi:hypothetical protein
MIDLMRILVAPLVWFASFSAVYGLHGALCGAGATGGAAPALIAAFAVAILLQVALLAALSAPHLASPSRFVGFVSRATGWVGLVATVWSLFPVLATSTCL